MQKEQLAVLKPATDSGDIKSSPINSSPIGKPKKHKMVETL
jgi:hypothetical protein